MKKAHSGDYGSRNALKTARMANQTEISDSFTKMHSKTEPCWDEKIPKGEPD